MNEHEISVLQTRIGERLRENTNLSAGDARLLHQSDCAITQLQALLSVKNLENSVGKNVATEQRSTMVQAARILMQMKESEENAASKLGDHAKALIAQAQAGILKHLLVSMGEKT